MNSNLSAYIRDYAVTATIKNRMTRFLCAGVVLFVVSGAMPRAGADDSNGFLPNQMIVSTVPPNGDLNPYGVAFVPQGFQRGNGPLQPGDILVSNFNNSSNLQGTGTTIVRVSRSGAVSLFFTATPPAPGATGNGLSTALAVLRKGFVIVGSVPSTDGTAATVGPGGLLVIDSAGNLVGTLSDPKIKGPWDMTLLDEGNQAIAFISNVLTGTVVRFDLSVATNGVTVTKKTVIASGYQHRGDPVAFEVGPTGLIYDPDRDVLYVASTEDNAVFAVQGAATRTSSGGKGTVIYRDVTHLHGPLGMAEAPNGHLLVANSDVINSDPNQPSEIVEFTKQGQFIKQLSVNPAQGGSFGLAVRANEETAFFAAVDDNTATLTVWKISLFSDNQ
jgi:hypothetical protein